MHARLAAFLIASSLVVLPSGSFAQTVIPYDVGEYEYAHPLPDMRDDIVTETVTGDAEGQPSVDPGTPPTVVSAPAIQTVDPSDPAIGGAMTSSAVRSIPSRSAANAPPTPIQFSAPPTYLPAGGQVVAFDRKAWLDQCRLRLETYENNAERDKVIGTLIGGVAMRSVTQHGSNKSTNSASQCQAYLDTYLQNASATAGTVQYAQPGQYMLMPVTVAVPQRPVYREIGPEN